MSRTGYKEIHRRNTISDSPAELWRIDRPFNHSCHAADIITAERYSMAVSAADEIPSGPCWSGCFDHTAFLLFLFLLLFRDLVTVNLSPCTPRTRQNR